MKKLIIEIDFTEENLLTIKTKLSQIEENDNHLNKISGYLLSKKFNNKQTLYIHKKNVDFKIFINFLEIKNDFIEFYFISIMNLDKENNMKY